FMDGFGLERPVVVGASLGGWLAAELAVHSPERVSRLVLLAPLGLELPEHPIADLFALSRDATIDALFRDRAPGEQLLPADPGPGALVQMSKDRTAPARLAWTPFCCNPKLERRLHRIAAPTLILWGDDDRLVPAAHGRRYSELIGDSRLRVIER